MIRKYTLAALCILGSVITHATYLPVTVTGFTDDVVANGTGAVMLSTTNNADGGITPNSWCFVTSNYLGPLGQTASTYLPLSGLITSVVTTTPGLTYQLASYSANNVLRLQGANNGTLTFATAQSAADIYVLAYSGNGASTMTATVTFTDATTQVFSSITVGDWFGNTGFAIQGISRVNRDDNSVGNSTTDPRLYQIKLALTPSNYGKQVQSINFLRATSSNIYTTLGIMAISINTPSSVSITSTATAAFCAGTSVTFTATPTNGGTTPTYQWKKNGTAIGGATGSTYTTTTLANGDIITVDMTSSTQGAVPSPATSNAITVTVNSAPAQPGTITGSSAPCGGTTQIYSVAAVTGATSYTWTLPVGWSGTSSTNSINTLVGSAGNITVTATNGCGSSPASSLPITLGSPTTATASVTGNSAVCPSSSQTYTATPVANATSYAWTLPSGWIGFSTTNSITVTTGTTGGSIVVSAVNGCGTGPGYVVPVTMNPVVASSVSVTSSGVTACSGTSVIFTATPVNGGATPTYQWKKNGLNVGTNSSTYSDNSLINGDQVSVVLTSSNLCPISSPSTAITMTVIPNIAPGINVNTQPGVQLCAGTPITFISNIVGGGTSPSYQWQVNGLNVGTNSPTYTSTTLSTGDVVHAILTSNAACATSPNTTSNNMVVTVLATVTPTVTVSANPSGPVPSGTNITFTANSLGGGTTPDYQWYKNSVMIPGATGSTYTTDQLHGGDLIKVRMVSYAPCPTVNVVTSSPYAMANGTGIASVGNWDGTLNLYPNPSTGHFTISADWTKAHTGERVRIDMVNALGQIVYNTEVVPDRAQWSVDVWLNNSIANGIYTLRVRTSGGDQAAKPVMIQR